MNITDRKIKSMIKANNVGKHSVGNGLYLRITDSNSSFWVLRYSVNGKRREMTMDSYPAMSLVDANAEVAIIKRNIKNGTDPLAERQRPEKKQFKTVNDLAEDWLQDCQKRLKYPNVPRQVYRDYIAPKIGALPIDNVNPMDIRATLADIAKNRSKSRANDVLMYCKQIFRHGVKLNLISNNPALPFTLSDAGGVEKSRDRALSVEELKIVFNIFHKYHNQFARENYLATALLLALGVRKGELIAAKWDEFNFDNELWHLPESRSKTNVPITIPLSKSVLGWLNELKIRAYHSEYILPNRRNSKRNPHISPDTLNAAIQKLFREKKLKIEHFTVHDLRRTFRSLLSSLGVPGHIAERCLNHKLKGVEGIYDRYDYLDERKEALNKISDLLAPIINKEK